MKSVFDGLMVPKDVHVKWKTHQCYVPRHIVGHGMKRLLLLSQVSQMETPRRQQGQSYL